MRPFLYFTSRLWLCLSDGCHFLFATGALVSFEEFGEIVDVVLKFFELLLKLYILLPELNIFLDLGVSSGSGGHGGAGSEGRFSRGATGGARSWRDQKRMPALVFRGTVGQWS